MKHLIIINPKARQVAGRVDEIKNDIQKFFDGNPGLQYAIHITRWKRDASGYILRYVSNAEEIVRVYAVGGSGTLFEVINGVVGLPNVQVAWYPAGRENSMLHAFSGEDTLSTFQSLRNLCLSPVITIDTIKAGNHYMGINTIIGGEAAIFHQSELLNRKTRLSRSICYSFLSLANMLFKNKVQRYSIETEKTSIDGEFSSILISNIPKGTGLIPAREACFDDGYMDLFTIRRIPRNKVFAVAKDYARGFHRWPAYVSHCRCKKLAVSSGSIMNISIDGEFFYEPSLEFEICPRSVDFVCPPGISAAAYIVQKEPPAAPAEINGLVPQEMAG